MRKRSAPSSSPTSRSTGKSEPRSPAPLAPPPRPRAPVAASPSPPRPRAPVVPGEIGGPWLWGRHAVLAALANPARKLLRLVATEDNAAELQALGGPAPQILGKDELQRLLPPSAVHQGMALVAKPLRPLGIEDVIEGLDGRADAVVVVLDQVTDPHNIGAVLRSAAAFGAAALIVPDRNAPDISGTLAKSASGAVEHVPLVRVVNLNRTLDQLKKAGFWTVGLDGAAERTLASHKLSGRVCLVLGSEGEGMRRLTRESCDLMAKLPTGGPIASLNVSNAAAIALYELVRKGDTA
ncbi:MAG: rRNA (guanosine2251-2-O)-methyltransferase [Aliidongia sp.]|nr:rRNA (guanosine2251-2-O)-methyltransferase [Aliidongia sp.]